MKALDLDLNTFSKSYLLIFKDGLFVDTFTRHKDKTIDGLFVKVKKELIAFDAWKK